MVTLDSIYKASAVLKTVARRTDLIRGEKIKSDAEIYLKTENLQTTGSFKLRGAYYKISQLTEEEKKAGIIACSAGNHAQGVALAATKMGIKSKVFMPAGAPISKVEATKALGAEVFLVPGTYDDAYEKACEMQAETGATFIHPFNDEKVIAGQGTIGIEVLDQLPEAEAVVVPIGGGGLISGVAFAIKNLAPHVKVYGVQAANAASMVESRKQGGIITANTVNTFADGIAVKKPGETTFKLIEEYVDDIVTVSEDEIAFAILTLMEQQKLVVEGAGAVSVAAAMTNKLPIAGKKTVCVVSGGNIDVTILTRVITRGLIKSGRSTMLQIAVDDKPGQLVEICKTIADYGANVLSVYHEHLNPDMEITSCYVKIGIETRDFENICEIKQSLKDKGFTLID